MKEGIVLKGWVFWLWIVLTIGLFGAAFWGWFGA